MQLCIADPLALLFTRRFHFFVASCTKFRCISKFAWWWKMTWTIHLYFCWNFRCTNLSVISNGNTVTPQGLVTRIVLINPLLEREKTPYYSKRLQMHRNAKIMILLYKNVLLYSQRTQHIRLVWTRLDFIITLLTYLFCYTNL